MQAFVTVITYFQFENALERAKNPSTRVKIGVRMQIIDAETKNLKQDIK
jgi:hypothetical protein